MVNPDLVNLPEIGTNCRGLYIFHCGCVDCDKLSFKMGMSIDIKKRLFTYHLSSPKGLNLAAILLADTKYQRKELYAMETLFGKYLLAQPGVELLKMTVRKKGTGEWYTVSSLQGKNAWDRIVEISKQFYLDNPKHFRTKYLNQLSRKFEPPLLTFKKPRVGDTCADQRN